MKRIFILIVILVSIMITSTSSYLSNIERLEPFSISLDGKRINVTSQTNRNEILETLMYAADESGVTLMVNYFDIISSPFDKHIYIHFGNQKQMDLLPLNRELIYTEFNQLKSGISSLYGETEYRIDIIQNKYAYELIPFSLIGDKLRLNHLQVSGSSNQALSKFQAIVNQSGNLTVQLETIEKYQVSKIGIALNLMMDNLVLIIGIVLLVSSLVFTIYRKQKSDIIKRLNGYSNSALFLERCREWIVQYFSIIIVSYPFAYIWVTRDASYFLSLYKYYLLSASIIAVFLLLTIVIMQISLYLIKPNLILKKQVSKSFYPVAIIFKVLMIFILLISITPNLADLISSHHYYTSIHKYEDYYKSLYFLVSSDESQKVGMDFALKHEEYYKRLSERGLAYIAVLVDENNSAYGAWIQANNAYINSLGLKTIDGKQIYLEANEDSAIVTKDKAETARILLNSQKPPFYCKEPINNSCAHLPLYIVDENTSIFTLGNQGQLNLINGSFMISTEYPGISYSQYMFKVSDGTEFTKLEKSISEVFTDIPLKLKSFSDFFDSTIDLARDRMVSTLKTVSVQALILLMIIVSAYQMMYEQYKQEISVKYLNGISVLSSSALLLVPQILTTFISILLSMVFYRGYMYTTHAILILTGLIILVEIIGYIIFSIILDNKVISNIKGG